MARTLIAYSDCIAVQDAHPETKLLQYSNENDFAGIPYDPDYYPIIFSLRLHAKFFEEREPEENESEGLSDGSVAKLSSETKNQKLLEVEPAPSYLHKIIKLALQHNTILIDEQYWEKEEDYETEYLNKKNPFRKGEVWLTVKEDEFFTNVFGELTQ